jgi:hypothetical protein
LVSASAEAAADEPLGYSGSASFITRQTLASEILYAFARGPIRISGEQRSLNLKGI